MRKKAFLMKVLAAMKVGESKNWRGAVTNWIKC